jgi:aminoglycoside N3'-acetyltransferase
MEYWRSFLERRRNTMVTKENVKDFIKKNGLEDSIICFHSSLKSFGKVENGPHTIIDGFIESNCTLVCPSFYYDSAIFQNTVKYERNGMNYQEIENGLSDMTFKKVNYTESIEQIDKSMGVIPKTLLSCVNTCRTHNPMNSFCINGKYSEELLQRESLDNAYSVYKNIFSNTANANIILAGVDLTSCTPIHYAEELAGRKLFRRWAVYNNNIVEVEVGSCSEGFEKIRDFLKEIEIIDYIGESQIRIYSFKKFILETAKIIQEKPEITICKERCERCMDMYNGGRCS